MERKSETVSIPGGGKAVLADYSPQVIEDYKDNPLIEALPPILFQRESY